MMLDHQICQQIVKEGEPLFKYVLSSTANIPKIENGTAEHLDCFEIQIMVLIFFKMFPHISKSCCSIITFIFQ